MISLAGIPPTAGFIGKFYLFMAAVNAGLAWLAIFGLDLCGNFSFLLFAYCDGDVYAGAVIRTRKRAGV